MMRVEPPVIRIVVVMIVKKIENELGCRYGGILHEDVIYNSPHPN